MFCSCAAWNAFLGLGTVPVSCFYVSVFEAQASILFNMSSEQKAYCPAKLITRAVAEIKKCDMRGSHAGEHTQHAFVDVRCAVDSEFISVRYGAAAVRLKYHENIRSVRRANIGKQAEDFKQLVVFLNQQEFLGGNINGNLPAFDNILKPEPQKSVKVKKQSLSHVPLLKSKSVI